MKKVILMMMTLIMCLVSTVTFAQSDKADKMAQTLINRDYDVLRTKKWFKNSPGDELKKYSKHFYIGSSLTLVGSGLIYLSLQDPADLSGLGYVGVITSLIGTVLVIESPIHLKRAGILLNNNGVGLQIKL